MKMRIMHELVGYDPKTDQESFSFRVPEGRDEDVKRLVAIPADDPDAVFSYELEPAKANDIAGLIGAGPLDPALAYYLEPCSEPLHTAEPPPSSPLQSSERPRT
ncbi:hypothetical protein [Salinarimonas sp.]|uniref:DUF7683 domain-containing protein n=1 Tax=Salinarimonas sp. TaxID=2766526 RepID=UPI0032D8C108